MRCSAPRCVEVAVAVVGDQVARLACRVHAEAARLFSPDVPIRMLPARRTEAHTA